MGSEVWGGRIVLISLGYQIPSCCAIVGQVPPRVEEDGVEVGPGVWEVHAPTHLLRPSSVQFHPVASIAACSRKA